MGIYDKGSPEVAARITAEARTGVSVVAVAQVGVRYVVYPSGVGCATAAEARRVVRQIEQEQDDE